MKTHSQKFIEQRRFYVVLPLLSLPFITLIFWALGGGQGTPAQASQIRPGLNLTLPGAHFDKDDVLWDKFALYEQAKRDSLQYEEARKNDPYYVVATLKTTAPDTVPHDNGLNTSLGTKDRYKQISEHETLINKKLKLLSDQLSGTQTLNQPAAEAQAGHVPYPQAPDQPSTTTEVDRLEQMMEVMSSSEQSDPEMAKLDGMLDKILDIQYPDRVIKNPMPIEENQKPATFSVELSRPGEEISLVEISGTRRESNSVDVNGFFGLEEESIAIAQTENAIQAVIHETQDVVSGSTVKLRLLADVDINGQHISKNQFVFGTCSISAERLMIHISSIRDEHSLYPVSLKAFDLDGIEGIYIPGAITRDAAKQTSSQSLQGMQLLSMDTSIGAQAAAAGIEATKGLLSKKAKLIKVTLKAGYQVLLVDKNQKPQ